MEKLSTSKRIWSFVFSQNVTNFILALIAVLNLWFYTRPFEEDDLSVSFDDTLFINQEWGRLNFFQTINVKNIGQKIGYVNKIKAFVRSKDSDQRKFSTQIVAKSYFNDVAHDQKPLLEIPLNINDSFNAELKFFNNLGRFEADSIGVLSNIFINETEQARKKPSSSNFYAMKDISKKNSNIIKKFILSRLSNFRQGEYEYIIEIFKDQETKPFAVKCYSFTIYQANIDALKESIKTYTQFNVFTTMVNYQRPNIELRLTELDEKSEIEALKAEIK